MVIVTAHQMNAFTPEKAHSHYPEVHVLYRSDDDCACFIRTPTGVAYKLHAMALGENLDSFLDGFADLKVWFHSDLELLKKKLGI